MKHRQQRIQVGICLAGHQLPSQKGQALTEFLVAAVAILPLFLLIPIIAKYQDINHATLAASRYVAFDAASRNGETGTWKSEAALADEVRRRFFSNPDAPIKTGDVAGDFKAHQNLFWRNPRSSPMIEEIGRDVTVSFGTGNGATHSTAFSAANDASFYVYRSALGLNAPGIYTGNVSVAVANVVNDLEFYKPFDALNLRMVRGTSLLINSWAAAGPGNDTAAHVESRISASPLVFPSASLAGPTAVVGALITTIDAPGGLQPPQLGQLDFWRDLVPADRLR
jgi:hypothetical protein